MLDRTRFGHRVVFIISRLEVLHLEVITWGKFGCVALLGRCDPEWRLGLGSRQLVRRLVFLVDFNLYSWSAVLLLLLALLALNSCHWPAV